MKNVLIFADSILVLIELELNNISTWFQLISQSYQLFAIN
jgi:hypothetical protein